MNRITRDLLYFPVLSFMYSIGFAFIGYTQNDIVRYEINVDPAAGLKRFDGIDIVNGGGATSVLLKDYPEPQWSEILNLVYELKFEHSVSTLLVEVPGDGETSQKPSDRQLHFSM